MRITAFFIAFTLLWGGFLPGWQSGASGASAPEELRTKIEEKAKELEAVNNQVQATQQNLEETKEQGKTLQSELKQINYDISRLGLNIKASEINIQKLSLELDGLQYDIADVQTSIGGKKEAIAQFLRELQQNDADNLLVVFLKNKSLADSISTAQSLADLNQGLAVEIANLGILYDELDNNIQLTSTKKQGIERENLNLRSRKGIVEDKRQERQSLLTQTRSREQTYQQQLAELEKKQEEIGRVIDELEHELRAAFDPSVLPLKRPGVLMKPVENGIMSQGYGATAFAQRAYKTKFHNGVDWAVPIGTPVFAAEDGVVVATDNNDRGTARWQKYQYGKYILIKHDNNLTTLYAHLSRQAVSRGATVKRGDLIGYSGNTGYATGPHIHFTVYWAPSVQLKSIPPAAGLVPIGVTIDPNDYL